LVRYAWPGNVRELENVIERAVILSPGTALQIPVGDLKAAAAPPSRGSSPLPEPGGNRDGHASLADAEREHILRTLRETDWVRGGPKGAATRLGMKRTTLQSKMKKLGIARPR